MEVGSRGALGNAEHATDLGMLESFDVVQDDDGALPFAQRRQCLTKTTTQLIRFTGIAKWRCNRIGEGVGVTDLLASGDVERGIRHDPVEPGTKRLVREEPIERSIGMEEAFLHGILGVFVREDDGARHGICATLVQPHQFRERLGLTALRRDDQGMLALARRVTRHGACAGRCRRCIRADREGESGHDRVS